MDTKALRQKILDLAIRGKLVPQDPNDEPASVLLERIREEKKQMVKDGKLKPKDIKNDTVIFKGEDNLHYEKFQDGTVKCIEDEIPFEVPSGWCWARVNTIIDVRDGTHDTPKYVDEGVPLFTSKNLSPIGLDYSNVKYISYEDAKSINERSGVDKGDILYAMIGTIGNPTIVDSDIEMSIKNVALFKFSYSQNLSNRYMLYFFSYAQEYMKKDAAGGLQPFVSLTYLRNYLVPVPPVAEQARICAKCDLLVKNLLLIDEDKAELSDTVERAKSKILDLAIRGKLAPQDSNDEPASVLLQRIRAEKEELIKQGKLRRDKKDSIIYKGDDNSYYEKFSDESIIKIDDEIPFDLPESWQWIRLKDVFSLLSGRDLTSLDYNDTEDGIPYITGASNFSDGKILINRWTNNPQVITISGDLLITCKGTVGEIAINNFGDAHIARQIMAIRNPFSLNIKYITFGLEYHVELLKNKSKGLIPGISRDDILNLLLPIPPQKEQERITYILSNYYKIIEKIEANLS